MNRVSPSTPMTNIVSVVPYDPTWPKYFADEAQRIKHVLGSNCIDIHHIGSTAVPGLSAKPIIDMLPVVNDIVLVDNVSDAMQSLGYRVEGEYGMPLRRYFRKGSRVNTHHVHVFEKDSPEIERHLLFRDWLRLHAEDARAYATLKIALAERFPMDISGYCLGKNEFVAAIETKTGFNKPRIVCALTDGEWKAVRYFRDTYFFGPYGINDPYTWTFQHDEHVHFVLYQATNIIGYAHIQRWPANRVALRIIVIDEPQRNKNSGSVLLQCIEAWLKTVGIKSIHVESRKSSLGFYLKNGYVNMPFGDPDGHESHPDDIPVGKVL